ncbi:protein of unknown function [Pedobacter caeni]|uniref:DUF5008 domain-containing protein n=2 Tax=Pedobacter caeni TaxID=288992 RepID=A0A1M5P8J9_9SPHI|nr:protein of unknown function [Pedobacter caeni]
MISIHKKRFRLVPFSVFILLVSLTVFSCKKSTVIGEDPYDGGKQPLGIKFANEAADPEVGIQGEEATFKIRGLRPFEGKFKVLINETEAEVLTLTDSTVKVKIPLNASTGGITVIAEGQTFFGPSFGIEGKVSLDASFKVVSGSNGSILDMIPANNGYLMVGGFSDFDSKAALKPVNAIAMMNSQGEFQSLNSGKGVSGVLFSANQLSGGQFIVAGLFNSYNRRLGISSIARLNSDGSLDSTRVQLINLTPEKPQMGFDTVSTFNGGVNGLIRKTFVRDNKITVVGNFTRYYRYFYERSTRDSKRIDITTMNQIVRMKEDGSMDSTFNFNPATRQGYEGLNGSVEGAFMQQDGKIVITGDFTSFNGKPVNRIARINLDGSRDDTFNTGSGADNIVTSVTYNETKRKIMLTGLFKNFNGTAANGVVMLNEDGSTDNSFKLGTISGGIVTFAHQLSSGKIILSGGFSRYNNVVRQGFMILNQNGSLAPGYNNSGAFEGYISKVIETSSSLGNPAVILSGFISKFDNKRVGNVLRVEIK